MIKVDIPFAPVFDSQELSMSYATNATTALADIRTKADFGIPIKSTDFKPHWKIFKYALWSHQHMKCCFCEQRINEQDCHVEHYRPKAQLKTETGNRIGYWWLAYDWRNLVVSCATCNRQKSTEFPLAQENARSVHDTPLDAMGNLDGEYPRLINPRFDNPEDYVEYDVSQCSVVGEVYIKGTDSDLNDLQRGNTTKRVLDLNRTRVNDKRHRDNLPGKRGKRYREITALWDDFVFAKVFLKRLRSVFPSMGESAQLQIEQLETEISKLREQINASMSAENEFAGLSRWHASIRTDKNELHS